MTKTIGTYIVGFGFSVALTFVAFGLVGQHIHNDHVYPSHEVLVPLLVTLAVLQLFVQLVCFLHLAEDQRPRWNFITFVFAVFVVVVLVGGTVWIMNHLAQGHADLSEIYQDNVISPQTQDD